MNVFELRDKLNQLIIEGHGEDIVTIRSYESGIDIVENLSIERMLEVKEHEWYIGSHKLLNVLTEHTSLEESITTIYLSA